jgi:hypothetical protein
MIISDAWRTSLRRAPGWRPGKLHGGDQIGAIELRDQAGQRLDQPVTGKGSRPA